MDKSGNQSCVWGLKVVILGGVIRFGSMGLNGDCLGVGRMSWDTALDEDVVLRMMMCVCVNGVWLIVGVWMDLVVVCQC